MLFLRGATFSVSALFLVLTVASCQEAGPPDPPIREALAVLYVGPEGGAVRHQPSESAEQLHTFPAGESISVLSYQGQWAEVRFGDGSAWMRRSDLTDSAEEARAEKGSTEIKFRNPPSPVYSQSRVHGEIVLEASVSEGGVVTDVRTVKNSTGSKALEMQNRSELLRASFYPLLVQGKPKPFIYEYRITY